MVKILFLGGSTQQVSAIKYAKRNGYFTVLCDYLPDNPGRKYCDAFYPVSTKDLQAVLEVAKKEKVNGIIAYASDPAATTAAYVAEKLGLPSNPLTSVKILSTKDWFRHFLKENGFNCPRYASFTKLEEAASIINNFKFPVIVKPVDLSGSKGVSRINNLEELADYFNAAVTVSRQKRVIIEEQIMQNHKYMIGGDCFVKSGKVIFWGLLNCHRDPSVNPNVPIGKSYPLAVDEYKVDRLQGIVQSVINLLGLKFGAFNLEIMFDLNDKPYLIEMGPRNGGNMIPDLLNQIYGVDLIGASVEGALGNFGFSLKCKKQLGFYSNYVLHAGKEGKFKGVYFKPEFDNKIIHKVIYKTEGEKIKVFNSADSAIGIVFLKFSSMEEMLAMMDNAGNYIDIILD